MDNDYEVKYYSNGNKFNEKWRKDGKKHREDGPADICYNQDGIKDYESWYKDGEFHRLDGPAYTRYYEDGNKDYEEWNLCGQGYTESEHKELVELAKSIATRDMAILNIRHSSKYIRLKCQEVLNV